MNKVMLTGRLGADPEFRTFESGTCVCNLSLATEYTYKNKVGEKVKETEWHRLVAWSATGKAMSDYLHKGSRIGVVGRIKSRGYEDQPTDCNFNQKIAYGDGTKAATKFYVSEIIVETFEFLDPAPTTTNTGNAVSGQAVVATAPVAVAAPTPGAAPVAAPAPVPVVPAPAPVVAAPVDPAAVQETFAPGTEAVAPVGV